MRRERACDSRHSKASGTSRSSAASLVAHRSQRDSLPTAGYTALGPKQVDAYAPVSVGLAPCILTTPAFAKGHERGNCATAHSRMNRLQSATPTCRTASVPLANKITHSRSASRFRLTTPARIHIARSNWWQTSSSTHTRARQERERATDGGRHAVPLNSHNQICRIHRLALHTPSRA